MGTDWFLDTPQGGQLLKNFAVGICGAQQTWTMSEFIGREIIRFRELVGPTGQVLGAVSGGVDSTVGMLCPEMSLSKGQSGSLYMDMVDLTKVVHFIRPCTDHLKVTHFYYT